MIYDISREMFSTPTFPGDPVPEMTPHTTFDKPVPDVYQVTKISITGHTGTHADAPLHFIPQGKDIAEVDISRCIGKCRVAEHYGILTADDIRNMVSEDTERLLIKGNIIVTPESAEEMVRCGLLTIGVEGMTVGTEGTIAQVHRILLGAEVYILENLVLSNVPTGIYFLSALPLKMAGMDGSPVRAVLTDIC
jgi:arylformamidase